jgi:hypothetical protein
MTEFVGVVPGWKSRAGFAVKYRHRGDGSAVSPAGGAASETVTNAV